MTQLNAEKIVGYFMYFSKPLNSIICLTIIYVPGLNDCDDVLPIYVGDDRTDEDAFKVRSDFYYDEAFWWLVGFVISKLIKVKWTCNRFWEREIEVMAF